VQADTQRLAQCIRNYLANAIRFSEQGDSIDVQVAVLRTVQASRLARRAPRSLDTSQTPPEPPLRINLSQVKEEGETKTQQVSAKAGRFVASQVSARRLG